MRANRSRLLVNWMIALMMFIGVVFPVGIAFAADKTSALTDVVAEITQNGIPIEESGTLSSGDPVTVEISMSVPVIGDNPDPANPVYQGDTAVFELSDAFTLLAGESTITLRTSDDIIVGHVNIADVGGMITATVTFDGESTVFDGTYNTVHCTFSAELQYDGTGDDGDVGNHEVTILNKTFTVNVPLPEIVYSMEKEGTADLSTKHVAWTVTVGATQGSDDVDLGEYQFSDDLSDVGAYVDGTFQVNGSAATPTSTDPALTYTFPVESAGEQTITFETEIPDDTYYATGEQSIANEAQLLASDSNLAVDAEATVTFSLPQWIQKTGVAGNEYTGGDYDPANRTITWTITANPRGATLTNLTITDALASGLTFQSAQWQTWNGTSWEDSGSQITSKPADDQYVFGTTDTQVQLILVSTVDNTDITTQVTTYNNAASLIWDSMPEDLHPGTGNVSVGIGYQAITKSGILDAASRTVTWTVNADARGQAISDMKVYDLLVYGNSINLNTVTGLPTGLSSSNLTPRYGQKYVESSFNNGAGSITVHPILQDGTRVADLLEISGLSTDVMNTFTFQSLVVNPVIYAGDSTAVYNTASLFSGITRLNSATGNVTFNSNTLAKELLTRASISDPAANVNTGRTTTAASAFSYTDKSAIFRLSVNADGLDYNAALTADSSVLGTATVTDILPTGWEYVPIVDGKDYLIFAGTAGSGSSVNATGSALDSVTGLTANVGTSTATFAFAQLNQPYVILVKARPTAATLADYFNDNKTTTATNTATLTAENWATGVSRTRGVSVTSTLLDKSYAVPATGTLVWTVNYNPCALENLGTAVEDTLPVGLDLRTDSFGNVLLDDITFNELSLNADGTLTLGDAVPLVLGENITYNNATRALRFTLPESGQAYRFTYLTDVTGDPGAVSNRVRVIDGSEDPTVDVITYSITVMDGNATLERGGWIEVTKTDLTGPLAGAGFTLYAADGTTAIRTAISGADGALRMRALPQGTYLLRETSAPTGYNLENVTHVVTVVIDGSTVITSIDGKTGAGANMLGVEDFLEGTVGSLTVTKTVVGGIGPVSEFEFTVMFTDAPDSYQYIDGEGNLLGTLSSGDTFSLAAGESITIVGLPSTRGIQ